MKGKVHYLCFYADESNRHLLKHWPSALPKISYVSRVLRDIDANPTIVSFCQYEKGAKRIKPYLNSDGIECRFMRPIPSWMPKKFVYPLLAMQIVGYILKNVRKGDVVLNYHSLLFRHSLPLARRLKKFRLITEVEELYYTFTPNDAKYKKSEIRLINQANGFLLINKLVKEEFNIDGKPSVLSHSSYKAEPYSKQSISLTPGKIHIVYAGCIESSRRAAFLAAEIGSYLPDSYEIHILGFGEESLIRELQEDIKKINGRGKAKVTYHGSMYGDKYANFLDACQIGLNTHTYTAETYQMSRYCFPSKTFIYLQHNLRIVSVPLESVATSEIGDLVRFVDNVTPKDFAKAIQSIDFTKKYDGVERLNKLDESFRQGLADVIENIK